jgi:hypothetical protein
MRNSAATGTLALEETPPAPIATPTDLDAAAAVGLLPTRRAQ